MRRCGSPSRLVRYPPDREDRMLRIVSCGKSLVFGFFMMTLTPNLAESAEPIRYLLRFSAPQTHYVEVEARVPVQGSSEIELMMAVWTPGSYLVREYARHLEEIQATGPDSKALELSKVRKNRWRVKTGGAAEIKVAYRVYGRAMSVQGNWVDGSFALLNGAATFLTPASSEPRPHEVALVLPPEWRTSVTGLPEAPGRKPHHYLAADFDTLVDSPIYAGNPAIYEFQVDGVPHYLVNEGEGGLWDGPRSARDVEAIVRAQKTFWGFLPYEKYVFINLLTESGGGLEHKNSTVLMTSRWATRTRSSYLGWLNLVSHEFFHTWNVKRLRPAELGPFDYENEVYTPSLWVAEGITSYYDRLLVRRAGLCTVEEYLAGDPPSPGSDADKSTGDIDRHQLLRQRRCGCIPARCQDTAGDLRQEKPRRRDAAGLRALFRAAGVHSPTVSRHRAGGRRGRSVVLVPQGPGDHRGTRLHRGPRLAGPPLRQGREEEQGREQAAQGVAGPADQE